MVALTPNQSDGKERRKCVNDHATRADVLLGLQAVDHVLICSEDDLEVLIDMLETNSRAANPKEHSLPSSHIMIFNR